MPGPPPLPTELKRKRGTARADRTPNLKNLAAVPALQAEPVELDTTAVLASVLEAGSAWLASTDLIAMILLRESLEEREQLRSIVIQTQSSDARKALRDLDKQINSQLGQLGFDPAARARLGLAEVKAASTLEKLRKSRG
jgi:hypothetical protein